MARKRVLTGMLGVVLAAMAGLAWWLEVPQRSGDAPPIDAATVGGSTRRRHDRARRAVASAAAETPAHGYALGFVAAGSTAAPSVQAVIGLAGAYPAKRVQVGAGETAAFPTPQGTSMWGQQPPTYEVLARDSDRELAFWGDVSIAGLDEPAVKQVALADAFPLEVHIDDDQGGPVAGAEVRVSRGFIGLVSLTKTTSPDGRVVFDDLPAGDFRVSVQADGFARRLQRVSHAGGNQPVTVSLEQGPTMLGNGQLDRLAERVAVPGNRTVVQTGTPVGGDGQSSRPRRPIDLYVVDRQGAPVDGALVELWRHGRRLMKKSSRGANPVRIELEAPFAGTLVAYDGRRGEGRQSVLVDRGDEAAEWIVRLNRALFSLDLPPGRINDRGDIERILGADLIRDDAAWRADILRSDCPAAQAGMERGDRVVFVQRVSDGYSVTIERGSQRMRVDIPADG